MQGNVLLRGRPMRNFLDVNGTISGAFVRHKLTELPFALSEGDLLPSHKQPCALKINVSQGCGNSLQHHVNNTEAVCTAVLWCNREMSKLQTCPRVNKLTVHYWQPQTPLA